MMMPGVCYVCGCTDRRACVAGDDTSCVWVDDARTLCSACLPSLSEEALWPRFLAEFEAVQNDQCTIEGVTYGELYAAVSAIQLALRNPEFREVRPHLYEVSQSLAIGLGHLLAVRGYALAEAVARGFLREHAPAPEPAR